MGQNTIADDRAVSYQIQSLVSLANQSPLQRGFVSKPNEQLLSRLIEPQPQMKETPGSCYMRRGRRMIPIEPVKTSFQNDRERGELLTLPLGEASNTKKSGQTE
jgi:hypothetical protein